MGTAGQSVYQKAQNKWWDGYCNERIALLDDLDHQGGNTLGHYLKIWADKWPANAECKGATIQLRHEWLVITSNYSIDDLFGPTEQDNVTDRCTKRTLVEAIARRFKVFRAHSREQMETVSGEIGELLASSNRPA